MRGNQAVNEPTAYSDKKLQEFIQSLRFAHIRELDSLRKASVHWLLLCQDEINRLRASSKKQKDQDDQD